MEIILKPATLEDYNFLYEVKKITLKKYIEQIWGWDEKVQKKFFADSFNSDTHQVIVYKGKKIGLLETYKTDSKMIIVELEILPAYQGQKIGTHILQDLMHVSRQNNILLEIVCFRINTGAKHLYENLGFKLVGETSTHYLFEY